MSVMSRVLRAALLVIAASVVAQAPVIAAGTRPAVIVGEVRVIPPAPPPGAHAEKGQKFRVKVPLLVESVRSEKVVRRKTVVTDTRFVLEITPGVYRVSSELGAPLVLPQPKKCGRPAKVDARPGRRVFIRLTCVLV
jgi:hypothetical protein